MKSIAYRLALALVAISLLFVWYSNRGRSRVMAQQHAPFTLTRLYTGDDAQTHVEQVNMKFSPVAGLPDTIAESAHVKLADSHIVRAAPGFSLGWHNSDARRYVVTLSGRGEMEVAGGQKILMDPGNICLTEDRTGKGHTFRVLGDSDWVALFIELAP